jgi:hypothetical protein
MEGSKGNGMEIWMEEKAPFTHLRGTAFPKKRENERMCKAMKQTWQKELAKQRRARCHPRAPVTRATLELQQFLNHNSNHHQIENQDAAPQIIDQLEGARIHNNEALMERGVSWRCQCVGGSPAQIR